MKTCKKHHRSFSYGNCPSCEDDARAAHRRSEDSTPFVMPTFDYNSSSSYDSGSSSSFDSGPSSSDSSSSSDFGGGGGFSGGGGGSDF